LISHSNKVKGQRSKVKEDWADRGDGGDREDGGDGGDGERGFHLAPKT